MESSRGRGAREGWSERRHLRYLHRHALLPHPMSVVPHGDMEGGDERRRGDGEGSMEGGEEGGVHEGGGGGRVGGNLGNLSQSEGIYSSVRARVR